MEDKPLSQQTLFSILNRVDNEKENYKPEPATGEPPLTDDLENVMRLDGTDHAKIIAGLPDKPVSRQQQEHLRYEAKKAAKAARKQAATTQVSANVSKDGGTAGQPGAGARPGAKSATANAEKPKVHLTDPWIQKRGTPDLYHLLDVAMLDLMEYTFNRLSKFKKEYKIGAGLGSEITTMTTYCDFLINKVLFYNDRLDKEAVLRDIVPILHTLVRLVNVSCHQYQIKSNNRDAWLRKISNVEKLATGIAIWLQSRRQGQAGNAKQALRNMKYKKYGKAKKASPKKDGDNAAFNNSASNTSATQNVTNGSHGNDQANAHQVR